MPHDTLSPSQHHRIGASSLGPEGSDRPYTKRPTGLSVPRVLLALALVVAVSLVVVFFADRAHLEAAFSGFRAQSWWLAFLIVAYTGAFWLRAVAWWALVGRSCGVFPLFVAIQAALLANHILPFKLGELVRPVMAHRSGLPLAQAAATTAVARMLDLAALVIIAAIVRIHGVALYRGRFLDGGHGPSSGGAVRGGSGITGLEPAGLRVPTAGAPSTAILRVPVAAQTGLVSKNRSRSPVDSPQLGIGGLRFCWRLPEFLTSSYRSRRPLRSRLSQSCSRSFT